MKYIIAVMALMAASSASAEYNKYGNFVTEDGIINVQNKASSYNIGDVIVKKGKSDVFSHDGFTWTQSGNTVTKSDETGVAVKTFEFDKNNNVVIGNSVSDTIN